MQNADNIIERAKSAFGLLSDTDFAKHIGVGKTTLSSWRARNSVNYKLLFSKCEPHGINLHWLLTGEGSMEKHTYSQEPLDERVKVMEEKLKFLIERDAHKSENNICSIPLYGHTIAAGPAADSTSQVEELLDLPKYMIMHPAKTYAVKACGDSMTGEGIEEGDILIVDRGIEPQHKNIVIASVNGEQTVKRLWVKGGKIKLIPGNSHYKPIEITKDMHFKTQGVVTWVVRKTA